MKKDIAESLRAKGSYTITKGGIEKYTYSVDYPFNDIVALRRQEAMGGPKACDVVRDLVHDYVSSNCASMPTIEGGKVESNAPTLNIRIEGVNPSNIVVN